MTTTIVILIGVIVLIAIASFIFKSLVKVILVLGVAYVLFHIGFIWNGSELSENLHLDKFLKPEVSEKVKDSYNQFSTKRDKEGVIQTDEIKKVVDTSINKALASASNQVKNIDTDKLVEDLSKQLKEFDKEEVKKILADLKDTLAKYNISPDDIQSTK